MMQFDVLGWQKKHDLFNVRKDVFFQNSRNFLTWLWSSGCLLSRCGIVLNRLETIVQGILVIKSNSFCCPRLVGMFFFLGGFHTWEWFPRFQFLQGFTPKTPQSPASQAFSTLNIDARSIPQIICHCWRSLSCENSNRQKNTSAGGSKAEVAVKVEGPKSKGICFFWLELTPKSVVDFLSRKAYCSQKFP